MGRFVQVGERFGRPVTLDRVSIARIAAELGDMNPLHHDEAAASRSRYGRIIASGPHTAGIFMGQTATFLSERGSAVGMGFDIRFSGPAFADEPIHIEWTVSDVQWSDKHSGEIVHVEGVAQHDPARPILRGSGKLLVTEAH